MDPPSSISSKIAAEEQAVQVESTTRLKSELYKAELDGNAEAFNVHQGSLQCLVTQDQNTVLHVYLASQTNRIITTNFVEQILDKSPSLLLKANAKGEIPFHIAARFGHANIVQLLIKRAKAEHRDLENRIGLAKQILRLTDNEENTACIKQFDMAILRWCMLIQEDPDFSYSVNKSGETPLYIAARRSYIGVVTMILDKCKSASHHGPCGRTALHAAVLAHDKRSTREILRKRKDLTRAADENGQTPLHYAAHFGYHGIVKLLLECDESAAYICDEEKMTPLLMAARQGRYWVMRQIIYHCPGCCEIVDKRGWTFYHFAVVSLPVACLYEANLLPNRYNWKRFAYEEDIHGNTPLQVFVASHQFLRFLAKILGGDAVMVKKENLDSKKKEQILQVLNEAGSGEVAGVAVRPLRQYTIDQKGFDKGREARSVVAALIATVTFAAVFTLPGGYKSDQSSDDQGTPILSHNTAFRAFVLADAIAIVSSLLAISFNYISVRPIVNARGRAGTDSLYFFIIMLSLLGEATLVVAFVTGLYVVLKSSFALAISTCTIILGFYVGFSCFCYYAMYWEI